MVIPLRDFDVKQWNSEDDKDNSEFNQIVSSNKTSSPSKKGFVNFFSHLLFRKGIEIIESAIYLNCY